MSKLTFDALRAANLARLPLFKNARGEPAHTEPDGSDWPLDAWTNATAGEAGEAANVAKKIRRGDYAGDEGKKALAEELADIVCYADLTAKQLGIDLGQAVIDKFNKVSDRIGGDERVYLDIATGLAFTRTRYHVATVDDGGRK